MDNKKEYVILKTTIRQLKQDAINNTGQVGHYAPLYYKEINRREKFTQEQIILQARNTYWAKRENWVIFPLESSISKIAEDYLYEAILDGHTQNLEQQVLEKIMDTEARIIATRNSLDIVGTYMELGEYDKSSNYIYDEEKFEDELVTVKHKLPKYEAPESNGDRYVYIESFNVKVRTRDLVNAESEIQKCIKKIMNEKFTYCIRNGEIIIPEEYLSKGKEGILEWRELRKSSNKSNSIEMKMLRRTYADKKKHAAKYMEYITNAIVVKNYSYKVPTLEIDGRHNKSRIRALTNCIFKDKSRNEFMQLSEEEILKAEREYWKKMLMDSYNELDKITVERVNKNER